MAVRGVTREFDPVGLIGSRFGQRRAAEPGVEALGAEGGAGGLELGGGKFAVFVGVEEAEDDLGNLLLDAG